MRWNSVRTNLWFPEINLFMLKSWICYCIWVILVNFYYIWTCAFYGDRVWTETCDCISGSELDHQWCPMILFSVHPHEVKLVKHISKHFEPAAYLWGTLIQASQPRRRPVSLPLAAAGGRRPAQAQPTLEASKSPSKWLKGKWSLWGTNTCI